MPDAPAIAPLLLNERQAAQALNLSPRTLFALRQNEGLPFQKIGTRTMYEPDAIRAWLQSRRPAATVEVAK